MRRLKLYLSHPFPERIKVREWEIGIEKKLDVVMHNPFYDGWESKWINEYNSKASSPSEYSRFLRKYYRKVVETDMIAIQQCDGTVAIVPYPSIGCAMEIFYTSHVLKKPVLIYQPSLIYSVMEAHPWLLYFGRIYKTLKGLERGILKLKRELL